MTPAVNSGPASVTMRLGGSSPADARRKAHARLADRIDLVRNRFKPLSLLRAEARRVLEQFYDQESANVTLTRPERDRLIEDVIAESVGFGPLEEVFRDEAVKEILVVNAATVLGRKNDGWLPMSCRFRDEPQWLAVLARWADVGEPYVAGPPGFGGFDVRLANGFRAVGVLPPPILEASAQAWLTRGAVPPGAASAAPPTSSSGVLSAPAPRSSGVMPFVTSRPVPAFDKHDSGVISLGAVVGPEYGGSSTSLTSGGMAGPASASMSIRGSTTGTGMTDPLARFRERVTAKMIGKFAAAGVYDLSALPLADLGRIVMAHVTESIAADRLGYDEDTARLLTGEILASMRK